MRLLADVRARNAFPEVVPVRSPEQEKREVRARDDSALVAARRAVLVRLRVVYSEAGSKAR